MRRRHPGLPPSVTLTAVVPALRKGFYWTAGGPSEVWWSGQLSVALIPSLKQMLKRTETAFPRPPHAAMKQPAAETVSRVYTTIRHPKSGGNPGMGHFLM